MPLTDADLNRRKHTCADCGSPLWQADKSGPARYPLADYVKHRMRGFFDLLVGDEVHEYKGRGSAQGIAVGVLADVCGKAEEGDNVIRVRLHPLPHYAGPSVCPPADAGRTWQRNPSVRYSLSLTKA